MKKIILIIIVCQFSVAGFCQMSNRLKETKSFVWLGLDFTQTKLRGTEYSFIDLDIIKNSFFEEMNFLMIYEKGKYNLNRAFEKDSVEYKIATVMERNKTKDMSNVFCIDEYSISKETLKEVISHYSVQSNENIGLLFIVETLDKIERKTSVWITFFDIKTKEILFAKNIRGKAQGFGFRNYWAGGIYNILKQCESDYYFWTIDKNIN